jgi:hypothetical protein
MPNRAASDPVLIVCHGIGAVLRNDDEGTFDDFLLAVHDRHTQEEEDEVEQDKE